MQTLNLLWQNLSLLSHLVTYPLLNMLHFWKTQKRRGNAGGVVQGGSVGLNQFDLMAMLKEQSDNTNKATEISISNALSEFSYRTVAKNTTLLATFGEGMQEQLGQFNDRFGKVKKCY